MKIIEEVRNEVHVSEMKDGDIAVITSWDPNTYVGKVMQRCQDGLIELGKGYEEAIPRICLTTSSSFKVRILPKGTKLEI